MSVNDWMMVTDQVRQAVFAGAPIVAVPSCLFMGEAIEQQMLCRDCIERQGAQMALVAVWKGKLAVGLSTDQMHILAQKGVMTRASRSEFGPLCARRASAAAGVALTMLAAQQMCIRDSALRVQRGQLVYKFQRMGEFIGKRLQFFGRKAQAGQIGQCRNFLQFHRL